MPNPETPLARRLTTESAVDAYSDGDATEWTLVDADSGKAIAVIVPCDAEGENYAQILKAAYNRHVEEHEETSNRG